MRRALTPPAPLSHPLPVPRERGESEPLFALFGKGGGAPLPVGRGRAGEGLGVRGRRGTLLALAVAIAVLAFACAPRDFVPTYKVERRPFQHRVTAEGTLKAEKATRVGVPPQVKRTVRLAWLAPEGKLVEEGDVIARFDSTAMERRLQSGTSDLKSATLEVEKTRIESDVQVGKLSTDQQAADLELDHAQRFRRTDTSVFSRRDILTDQIDEKLADERKQHAASAQERQRSLGRTELELVAIEQHKAQLVIDEAREGLQALEVRAPHAGLLTLIRNWQGEPPQVGAEMWRGQEIAEIPNLAKMEAEVFVLEADAGGLEVGKPATVIVEADPGTLHAATIKRVDAVAKPRFRGSPVQYFGVTLELDATDAETMKPGQRVRAGLLLAEVEDALVVPRQAVTQENGASRVFVRDGGEFVPRTVTVATSSMGLMVISEGLAEGDVIALRPPASGGESQEPARSPQVGVGR